MAYFGLYDDYVEERTNHKEIKVGDLVQILPTADYIDPDLDTYDVVNIKDEVAELLGTHTGKRLLGPLRGLVIILRKEYREDGMVEVAD